MGSQADKKREDLFKTPLSNKAASATGFMLAVSDRLWESIQDLSHKTHWTRKHTALLCVYLRYYLNDELAYYSSLYYAPAVARAQLVNAQNTYILRKLSTVVGNAAKKLEPQLVGTPSISQALVYMGKSDPIGIIEEAIVARNRAKKLRIFLASLIQGQKLDTPDDVHHIREGINEKLRKKACRKSGISSKSKRLL